MKRNELGVVEMHTLNITIVFEVSIVDSCTCYSSFCNGCNVSILFNMYVQDPNVSCVAGLIENFTISFNPPTLCDQVSISRHNKTYCNAALQQCYYTHEFSPKLPVAQFDVEVTASNAAGKSPLATLTVGK